MPSNRPSNRPIDYDAGYGRLLETRVRIATWNLWGRYGPWEERMPAITETLRAVDADIVGLQEVWDDDRRSQASDLAAALGYTEPVYEANLERDGARSGNAVLSRWPIDRREVRRLRARAGVADDEGEERLALLAEVDGPRGPIQVFCAHLSWRADHSGIRQEQVGAICGFVRESRPRSFPAVLLGDLNADPDSDELRVLTGQRAVPVPGVLFRDVQSGSVAAIAARRGRTTIRSRPRASTSTAASTTSSSPPERPAGCGQPLAARRSLATARSTARPQLRPLRDRGRAPLLTHAATFAP